MSTQAAPIETAFECEHGVHAFTAQRISFSVGDGEKISVISQPDWESFAEALDSVPPSSDIVLGPELITVDGEVDEVVANIGDLRSQRSEIDGRIKKMLKFSAENPNMIVTLSTPTFNGDSVGNSSNHGPYSSFLFIRDGKVVAQTHQQFAPEDAADRWFSLDQARGGRTVNPHLAGIAGVDLVGETDGEARLRDPGSWSIGRFAQTVLVSSGVTLSRERLSAEGVPAEGVLEGHARALFEARPDINEVIIADRVSDPLATGAEGPLNAHFVRTPSQ